MTIRMCHLVGTISKLSLVFGLLQETHAFVADHTLLRPTSSRRAYQRHDFRRCVNMHSHVDGNNHELATKRRTFLKAAAATATVLGLASATPTESQALTLAGIGLPFPEKGPPEQAQVQKVASYSTLVSKVEKDLREGELAGGKEDSDVVVRFLDTYLKPMQETMLAVAPAMTLDQAQSKDRLKLLPLLMKGHLLELEEACKSQKAKDQLREVEEVRETLEEFITLAKTNYDVGSPQVVPSEEEFGIFGCRFYGMKRVDGTNTCQPDP